MAIRSSKFSFVRFNSDFESGCSDISYVLPAFNNHDVAFQFEAVGNVDPGVEYTVARVAEDCTGPVAIDVPVLRLNLKGVLTMSQPGDFFLQSITYGEVTNEYDAIVSLDEFIDTLSADFGIEARTIDGGLEFFTICDLELSFTATTEADGAGAAITSTFGLYYGKGYVDISQIAHGVASGCFRIAIMNGAIVEGCSNAFKVINDPCYTSLFRYSCKEPAFEFVYPDTPSIARVPAYLTKPAWPKKREVYRRSTGRNQLLSAVVDKLYPLITDHMPEVFHECMAIALSHDDIIIENTNIREGVVEVLESDDYAVDWISEDAVHNIQPVAQGKGRLKVAKYSYSNSNCGVSADPCAQDVPPPEPCEAIDGDFTLNFTDPPTFNLILVTPLPEGDAIQILVIERSSGFVKASTTSVCNTPGGCEGFNDDFDIYLDDPPVADNCYDVQMYRLCKYTTGGSTFAPPIEKTGFGDCGVEPPPIPLVNIASSAPGLTITNVTGIAGFTFNTGAPISSGGSQTQLTHDAFTVAIEVTFGGTLVNNPTGITLSKNGIVLDCIPLTATGTAAFNAYSFDAGDRVSIDALTGNCP